MLQEGASRKAYIGIGFSDRADSFDLNVALQDHFKQIKKEEGFTKEADEPPGPKLDLAFKAGQVRVQINAGPTGLAQEFGCTMFIHGPHCKSNSIRNLCFAGKKYR